MDSSSSRKMLDFGSLDGDVIERSGSTTPVTSGFQFDVAWREHLLLPALDREDTSAWAGVALTAENIERAKKIETLQSLVRSFAITGLSLNGASDCRISLDARDASLSFIRNLDAQAKLPKLAPDGEGGLMLLWQDGQHDLALIVEGTKLHMVINPSGPNAHHVENIYYGMDKIPPEVFGAIPRA